jgi:MoxR-like ATPase
VVNAIHIDEKIRDYIVAIIQATRTPEAVAPHLKLLIRCGASPRGTINLALASKALAFLHGRNYVTPQDIQDLAPDILRHRILPSYEAEAEEMSTDTIIDRIVSKVPVP